MAQTIEYADFALVTGLNNGSSWANAYQTPTDLMAGDLANGPGYDYHLASGTFAWTTNLYLYNAVASGTAAQPVRWISVDKDTDTIVNEDNWIGFGGTIGTVLDFTGAAANQDGIYSEGRNHRQFIGLTILNCTSDGFYFYSGHGMRLHLCESDGATTSGVYTRTNANIHQCIFRNSALGIGSNAGDSMIQDCFLIDNTTGYSGTSGTRLRGCVFSGFTTGATGYYFTITACSFYSGSIGVQGTDLGWGVQIKDSIFQAVTTVAKVNAAYAVLENVKYYGQTTVVDITTGGEWPFGGNEETASAPLLDPASDDYRSDPTVTELINNSTIINGNNTIAFRQSGLPAEQPGVAQDGIVSEVTNVAANTTETYQEITYPGFGLPKSAILVLSRSTVLGAPADNNCISFGVTDGTTHACMNSYDEHNVGTTDNFRENSLDIIKFYNPTTGVLEGSASFVSWTVDGIRIKWDTLPPSGYLITCTFISGTDLSPKVGYFTLGGVEDSDTAITGIGNEPDQILFFATNKDWPADSGVDEGYRVGFADNGDSLVQGSVNFRGANGETAGDNMGGALNNRVWANIDNSDFVTECEMKSFDADGFTVTKRNNASSKDCAYLTLNYNGAVSHWVGNLDTPTSTGDDVVTGLGFKPQIVFGALSHYTVINTWQNSGHETGTPGISIFTPNDEYCNAFASELGADPTNTQSQVDSKAINFPRCDGAVSMVATLKTMDTDGFTLDYTSANATARKTTWLAIGEYPKAVASGGGLLIHPGMTGGING